MSLRILFVVHVPPDPYGAVFSNVCHRAASLRQNGHVVDVLTRADLPFKRLWRLDPLLLPLAVARRIQGYDVVAFHSHLGWAFHAARRWFDRGGHTRTVTVFHGLEPLYHRAEAEELARGGGGMSWRGRVLHTGIMPRLLKLTCRRSDAVLCLNTTEREFLVSEGWAAGDRVHIVANGIEPELLAPRAYRGDEPSTILFVAQWLPRKGTRYLVEAFTRIAAGHPHVRLVCAGTRATEQTVLADFPAGVRPQVVVKPHVSRAQLGDELRRADIFVFPSLFEGFSGALLEGMAGGLPIVATPAGAATDHLRDGENALVIPYASAAALHAAIERLLGDAALCRRLGEAARESAASYTWDAVNAPFMRHLLGTPPEFGAGVRADT